MRRRIRRTAWVLPGGDTSLRPLVTIAVRAQDGNHKPLQFWIDTGADYSIIPIARAQHYHIPFSTANPIPVGTVAGSGTGYLDNVTVRIFGQERTWPCLFMHTDYNLLGLAGFLDDCSLRIDDSHFTIKYRRPLRPFLHWLWPRVRSWAYPRWTATVPI